MKRLFIAYCAVFASFSTHAIQCAKGLQPYGERCITQKMADYVSCVESSGGNKSEIDEEIDLANKEAMAGSAKGSGKATVVSGEAGIKGSKKIETIFKKKAVKRWGSESMKACLAATKIGSSSKSSNVATAQSPLPIAASAPSSAISITNNNTIHGAAGIVVGGNVGTINIPPQPEKSSWQECQRMFKRESDFLVVDIQEMLRIERNAKINRERCLASNGRPSCGDCQSISSETKLLSKSECKEICAQ